MSYPTASTEPRVENPAPDYCDPKITSAVEEAYEAVWTIIQNNGPSKGAKTECERKAELSLTIGALVVDGVTDPAELRDRALAILVTERSFRPIRRAYKSRLVSG